MAPPVTFLGATEHVTSLGASEGGAVVKRAPEPVADPSVAKGKARRQRRSAPLARAADVWCDAPGRTPVGTQSGAASGGIRIAPAPDPTARAGIEGFEANGVKGVECDIGRVGPAPVARRGMTGGSESGWVMIEPTTARTTSPGVKNPEAHTLRMPTIFIRPVSSDMSAAGPAPAGNGMLPTRTGPRESG